MRGSSRAKSFRLLPLIVTCAVWECSPRVKTARAKLQPRLILEVDEAAPLPPVVVPRYLQCDLEPNALGLAGSDRRRPPRPATDVCARFAALPISPSSASWGRHGLVGYLPIREPISHQTPRYRCRLESPPRCPIASSCVLIESSATSSRTPRRWTRRAHSLSCSGSGATPTRSRSSRISSLLP